MNSYNEFDVIDKIVDEAEEDLDAESELVVEVKKFGEAVIWGTDWTTETVARQLEKGTIDLSPSFQRRDAWTNQEKSRLIESLMLGLPVPPIILAENKEKKNTFIVIDGKQRLLSIRRFFAKTANEEGFSPLKLSGLEILPDLNGKTYEILCQENNTFVDNFENQPVRTVVIKNWPDEAFLYTVFLRLNTGSKKLSPQELRQALIPGPFLNYLDEKTASSDIIQKMLGNTAPDSRMKDVELALRYYGFKCNLKSYDGNLKNFLDETCRIVNRNWGKRIDEIKQLFDQLEIAIDFSYKIMDNNTPFSRYENGKCNNRFNKNIYELFTYYFSDERIRKLIYDNKQVFVKKFIEMNDSGEFLSAVSGTTKDIRKLTARFKLFWEIIASLDGAQEVESDKVTLEDGKVSVRKLALK